MRFFFNLAFRSPKIFARICRLWFHLSGISRFWLRSSPSGDAIGIWGLNTDPHPDSPRVYVSTNPWKTTATFQSICSTKEEYLALIDQLKQSTPATKGRRSKLETLHVKLIDYLESRLEAIDAELAVSGISYSCVVLRVHAFGHLYPKSF